MIIWKTEYLKYKYFFGAFFFIEILLDILHCLNMLPVVDGVDTVYSFWQMLSWIAIVALAVYDFFTFFYLGKDRLLHLLPVEKSKILWMKSFVLGSYMIVYFLVGLIRYLVLLPEDVAKSKLTVAVLYISSKVIAIIAFFALITATLTIVKCIKNKVIGAVLWAVLLAGIVSIHAYGLYGIINLSVNVDWTIGIVDGAIGINQYANILPIVFSRLGEGKFWVEDSFYMVSLVWNLLEAIAGILITKILLKKIKFNYVEL